MMNLAPIETTNLGRAEDNEQIQILESLLEMPGSVNW